MSDRTFAVQKCPANRNCWWIDGIGHLSGYTDDTIFYVVAQMRWNSCLQRWRQVKV